MQALLLDLVWPGVLSALGLLSFWLIFLSILIEWPFVQRILRIKWWPSLLATLLINFTSALLGALFTGIFTGVLSTLANPQDVTTWIFLFLITAVITTCIEVIALVFYTETSLFTQHNIPAPTIMSVWGGLLAANTLSVGLIFLYILWAKPISILVI